MTIALSSQSAEAETGIKIETKLPRRKFLQFAGATALPVSRAAAALDYPKRPVRLLIGFSPGGSADVVARLLAEWLSKHRGLRFLVENHPGAGGNIATAAVAHAQPDGYTLLVMSGSNAYNAALYDNLNFDFLRDITPVASIVWVSGVMVVNPSVPAKTVREFIDYAKSNPGKISMATGGIGSGPHLYGELFKKMAGVDLLTVHYRGSGPALPDLLSGRIQVMFDLMSSSIEFIRAGKLRALGVTVGRRTNVLPDVPPIGNFVPGYETTNFHGLGAPAETPVSIINRLNEEVNTALADPTFSAQLGHLGTEAFSSTPTDFGSFLVQYADKWRKVIRAAGIK